MLGGKGPSSTGGKGPATGGKAPLTGGKEPASDGAERPSVGGKQQQGGKYPQGDGDSASEQASPALRSENMTKSQRLIARMLRSTSAAAPLPPAHKLTSAIEKFGIWQRIFYKSTYELYRKSMIRGQV